MSEIGTREHFLNAFKSADAFTSWLGLCPENCISGGRTLKSKTRKVIHRLADAFRLSANAVTRSNDAIGQYCRRMKGRLGKAEGILAVHTKSRELFTP